MTALLETLGPLILVGLVVGGALLAEAIRGCLVRWWRDGRPWGRRRGR